MLQGDDIRRRDGQCLTIMRIQSVLGAADVWRMAAMAPKGLWWDKEQHKLTWLGSGAEKIISQWSLTMPNAPAQRCYNCNILIIQIQ